MRDFGPSLLALFAGVAWLGISTSLIPASEGDRALAVAQTTTLARPCSTAMMIARLPDVHEASGLAVSRRAGDVLWTHNDSGDPVLYAIGTDGKLRGRVRVAGAQVDDWEDISSGPCPEGDCLYIADIGDNKEQRSKIVIYRIPEPEATASVTSPATAIRATYPDRPQDAEGVFVGPDGALFIVTKGEGSPINIYRVPMSAGNAGERLERIASLGGAAGKDRRITDADSTPDAQWTALRTLGAVEFHRTASLLAGKMDDRIEVKLTQIGEPQGEGVAILSDGTVYLAGEAGNGVRGGTLARVSCKLP